jgi:hypothetical protein
MMNNRVLKVLTILILALSIEASYRSVQWQKYELEQSLQKRINKVVGQVLDKNQFFVEVNIEASGPSVSLPKYVLKKKSTPKINGYKNTKSNGDLILMDKLGLEAPVYEGNYFQSDSEVQLELFKYSKRVERDYAAKMDLFANIEKIFIKVGVDKTVPSEKVDGLKKLITDIVPKVGEVKPELTFLNLDLRKKEKKTLLDRPGEFLQPIAYVLAAIIFSMSAYIVFSRYKKLQEEMLQSQKAATKDEKEEESQSRLPQAQNTIDPNLRPGSEQLSDAISEIESGVDRFCLYLEKSTEQSVNLVKKWLSVDTAVSRSAIYVISERLSVNELYKIFVSLSNDERELFRSITGETFSPADKKQGEKYLGQQVLEDIMVVAVTDDKELQRLLVEISPQKAAVLVTDNMEIGAVMLNLVSTEFMAGILSNLNVGVASEVYEKVLSMKEDDLKGPFDELKEILKKYIETPYKNPFERNIVEVMQELDYARSEGLLDVLVSSQQFDLLEEVMKSVFPGRLVSKLPETVFKATFRLLKTEAKVELLMCLDEKERKVFLNKAVREGTKGRELIDFELSQNLDNDTIMSHVLDHKDRIYGDFVALVRDYLKSDEKTRKIAANIAKCWLDEVKFEAQALEFDAA